MKKLLFAANWKLNKTPAQTKAFLQDFIGQLPKEIQSQTLFFPSTTSLDAFSQAVHGTQIQFGSQNCHTQISGAFTGEVSAQVVQEMGGKYILLGHSERRTLFGENDAFIADKVKLVQSLGLHPMLCIGETLEERLAEKTNEVLKHQLDAAFSKIDPRAPLTIAYEPVWAIGTGVVAKNEQVQETHAFIHSYLAQKNLSHPTPILYGGSVKGANAKELGQIDHVDGFLVGGASLEVKTFLEICLV